MRKPCPKCPFRAQSPLGYDKAGLEALDEGREPSCHVIVGAGKQFDDPMPSDSKVCLGAAEFMNGVKGFQRPFLELE